MKKLLDSILFPDRVDVGNLIFWQRGEVEVDLVTLKAFLNCLTVVLCV